MSSFKAEIQKVRPLQVALAVIVTLVVNFLGLQLMVKLNRSINPPEERSIGHVSTIDFQPLKRKKSQHRPQRTRRNVPKIRNVVAPPNLPSAIQSPALLAANLDMSGLMAAEFDDISADDKLIMTEETVDDPPKARRQIAAAYPQDAADNGIEGYVQLKLLVNRDGFVEKVVVTRARPKDTFEDAARRAAIRWTFSPAMFEGKPVAVWVRQKMLFKLDNEDY